MFGGNSGSSAGTVIREAGWLALTFAVDLPGIIRRSNSLCMDQRFPLGCRYLWHRRLAEQRLAPSQFLLTVQLRLWLIKINVNHTTYGSSTPQ